MRRTLVFAVFYLLACAKSETDDGVAIDSGTHADATHEETGSGNDVGVDSSPADTSVDSATHDSSLDGATDSGIDSSVKDSGAIDSGVDTSTIDSGTIDSGTIDTGTLDTGTIDSGTTDSGTIDSGAVDSGTLDTGTDTSVGPITGGPCISGATGATAFRIKWIDGGGTATVSYEVDGLPDKTGFKAGAYGYSIGFTPSFVDPFLGDGGLQLDDSDFVDVNLSTVGLSTIRSVTLSIYGRSYDTTTSGSFNWQTFVDVGATPTDFVSNVAPYSWYSADATSAFTAGDAGALLRIKAGPSSDALVVNRIELCIDAD